ncbi:MAG: 3-oxoacyl-ACP synthase III [Thermoguttaceae bacterium]|nr:3-oxoacyl-ACP synthase III [Thermoguttaceae bacterium]
MKYENVCVEAIECALPPEIVTTDELENRLAPLYERLKLPFGRLELMTGIQERGLWERGRLPGDQSVDTVEKLLQTTGVDRSKIGMFVHASVCRDYQEPATACDVHRRLGLPQSAVIFDLSNACLGLLTGALQIANAIELGQIDAGIVVGTETSRALMETTVDELVADETLTRRTVKDAFASLTIGSGSAAILLTNRSLSRTGNRLLGASVLANTEQSALCRSQVDVTAGGRSDGQTMKTDSETLLREGVAVAAKAFERFAVEIGWDAAALDRVFCHQVGKAHQKLLFETLGLDDAKNFATFPLLGNTGSVALPTAAALGIESGFARPGDKLGLFGIGSGINVVLAALDWKTTLPSSAPTPPETLARFLALNAG